MKNTLWPFPATNPHTLKTFHSLLLVLSAHSPEYVALFLCFLYKNSINFNKSCYACVFRLFSTLNFDIVVDCTNRYIMKMYATNT